MDVCLLEFMRKRRLAAGMLAFAMLLGGCGSGNMDIAESGSSTGRKEIGPVNYSAKPGADVDADASGGMPLNEGSISSDSGASLDGSDMSWELPAESAETKSPESVPESVSSADMPLDLADFFKEPQQPPAAGLLTAGEWCDNQNWGFFANLVKTGRFNFHVYGIKPYERVIVHTLSNGEAVQNASVVLFDANGEVLSEAVTDYSGTAYLYYNLFDQSAAEPAYITITSNAIVTMADLSKAADSIDSISDDIGLPENKDSENLNLDDSNKNGGNSDDSNKNNENLDSSNKDSENLDGNNKGGNLDNSNKDSEDLNNNNKNGENLDDSNKDSENLDGSKNAYDTAETNNQYSSQGQERTPVLRSQELSVEIGDYTALPKRLDLMMVFDTTGSMGDELLYIQKEFEDIVIRAADQNTRFSLNFYRDVEDEYIVRSNGFTADVNEASTLLNAEYADGGGDYEEAVDLALMDAVFEHDWRDNSVKLLFLVLDAPPHNTTEAAANLKEALRAASAKGIRIIPIASSGVDETTEALLRNIAMITGGTYTFLTDDSGIGESHLEPTIGAYTVEALNDLIVRLIQQYY